MGNEKELILQAKFIDIISGWFKSEGKEFESKRHVMFSRALTIWLMILQRATKTSMSELINKMRAMLDVEILRNINPSSKKIRFNEISESTAGYSQAKNKLLLSEIRSLLLFCTEKIRVKQSKKTYLIDGYFINTAHTKENVSFYGLHKIKDEKELHNPKVRVVAAHDLEGGISEYPEIGTFNDGEQRLGLKVIERLPAKSTIIGDRNFGIFLFAYHANLKGQAVVLRLKESIFKRATQNSTKEWIPSTNELNSNKDYFESINNPFINGRFIAYENEQKVKMYFFTNDVSLTEQQVADLYLRRQEVEIYIRQLKQDLNLELINAKKPDSVEKDLLIGILTFNLLSSIRCYVAKKHNIPVRRISFSAVVIVIETLTQLGVKFDNRVLERVEKVLSTSLLPNRKKFRSFPRVLKRNKNRYPVKSNC